MKRVAIMLISLFLVSPLRFIAAEPDVTTIEAKLWQESVSLDDFILQLEGNIKTLEEEVCYQYEVYDLIITVDLTKGYGLVNDQPEPYLLSPSGLDNTVLNIVWHLPTQLDGEVYVPIQFIERLFKTTYDETSTSFIMEQIHEIEEEEDVEEVMVAPSKPQVFKPIQSAPSQEEVEVTPPPTPQLPATPKPEMTPPISSSKPEEPGNQTPPSVAPPVIEEPEEELPPVEEDSNPEMPDPDPVPPVEEIPDIPEEPENPTPPTEEPDIVPDTLEE